MKANLKVILNAGSILLTLVLIAVVNISFESLQKKEYPIIHTTQESYLSANLLSSYLIIKNSIPEYRQALWQLKASMQERVYPSGENPVKLNKAKATFYEFINQENLVWIQTTSKPDGSLFFSRHIMYGIIICCGAIIMALVLVLRYQLKQRGEDVLKLNKLNESLHEMNQKLVSYHEELHANRKKLFVTEQQLELVKKEFDSRLEERTAILKESNEKLEAEVVEHKRATKELEKRNYELDNYVYKVSHDLRAPLSSILGLMNLIESETNPDTVRQYTNLIGNRALKLDDFIKSILNHSKTINSAIQISKINFEHIVHECVDELKYLPAWHKIKISISIQAESAFYSDELRITVLFKNFISNAIKYHNPAVDDNYLTCNIQVAVNQAIIQLKDNGIGISPEYKDKIFNMFFRATASSDGSGLGLYIVQQTLEKLEGTIQVESELNKGTTFILQLPNFIHRVNSTAGNS